MVVSLHVNRLLRSLKIRLFNTFRFQNHGMEQVMQRETIMVDRAGQMATIMAITIITIMATELELGITIMATILGREIMAMV